MKKILSMVLTLSIVLGTIGVPVFAEEVTSSAKIGDESYATLSDALSAASSVSDEVVGVTTPSGTTEVTGNVTYAYVSTNANTPIWGEGGGNASESLEFKLYEGDKEIAVTELNNVDGIIDGDVYVTWNFFVENTDNYWTTKWAEGYPKASMQPDTVKVFVDGVEAGSNAVKLNAPDDLNKIVAAAEDENGFIGYFTTPADAIKAAAPAGTVELLTDVTVDEWVMFAESLSISNGQLITLVIDGMTINGNGNTLTVNSIESANNGARLFYDATNLNINNLTIKCADGVAGGIGLKSGIIDGVTFEGGVCGVLPGEGDVTIEGCTFNTNSTSIYFEDERDNLIVTGNTFNNANDANVILLRGGVQFTNNVVNSGRTVNIVSGSPVVAGNDFNGVRLKVYPTATATVSNNEINNLVFEDAENETTSIFTGNTLSETAQAALDAVTAKTTGLSGSGTEEDPYKIGTKEEMFFFAEKVNDGTYKGVFVELIGDIDLEQDDWTSIGTLANPFTGTFDGKGYTISNIWSYDRGLFGVASIGNYVDSGKNGRATIKNLIIDGVEVYNQTTSAVGGVIGQAGQNTEMLNVNVTGHIQVYGYGYVGGIVGQGYVHIDDCHVIGVNDGSDKISEINAAYWAVAGIVGHAGSEGGSSITNCSVENVKIYSAIYGAGAIAGVGTNGPIENVSAKDVIVAANSSPDANGFLVGCNYKEITGNSIATNVKLLVNDVEYIGADVSAKIGDVSYVELTSAINDAVDGDTITLLCDVTQIDGVIITDKKLTIDLNGKTFAVTEGTSTKSRNFLINGSSVATIKNGIMEAKGDYSSGAYGTVRTEGAAYVTLKDLTLYNYRGNGLNIKACSGTKVDISDTVVYSQYGGGIEAAGGEIELTNVTVDQKGMYTAPYNSMAISVNGGGKVTVNSGIYSTLPLTAEEANNQGSSHGSWAAGVLNSGGTLIINDGTFANGNYGDDSLATAARGLILRDTHGVVEINGGTFNALGKIIDYQNNLGDATGNEIVTIKGGTFNARPLANTYEQYVKIPEGYAAIENLSGKYVVGVAPTATVIDHGPTVIPADEHSVYDFATGKYNSKGTEDMPLNFVVQFIADESAQAGAVSPYADWYADFVLTFDGLEDGSFNTEGCYLAGYYGDFGWVKIDISKAVPTVEKGVHYPVMLGVGLGQKYDYICSGVKDFKCAMYLTPEVLEANPNLKVNLDLVMVDNSQGQNEAYRTLVNGTGYLVVNNEYEAEDFIAKKELFEITLASVTFGNNLDMSFAIPKNSLADWTGHYVEIVKEYADGRDNVIKTVPCEELQENGNFYVVTFNGIAAKEMTDNLYVTVYDTDGNPVSKTREDSIRAYADRVYASQSDSLKTIIADMLNYGASAQDYFNDYNITKLANADFDTEFVTKEDPTVVNSLNASNDNFVGSSIVLSSNIDYRMAFKKSMGDITKATIEFTNHYDKPVSYELTKDNIIEEGDFYIVIIDKVVVADARQLITVKLYNGDTELVSVVDSIESYARRMQDRNDPFTPTIMEFMKFADAADAYFDSLN